ncbi:MAG: hypothetical protein WC624_05850 [Candidatus Margulisiibacteriota bacterium]
MDYFSTGQILSLGNMAAQKPLNRKDASNEFAKIFYKELIRQVFSNQGNEDNVLTTSVNQDIFIDKMAEEMARKNASLLKGIN